MGRIIALKRISLILFGAELNLLSLLRLYFALVIILLTCREPFFRLFSLNPNILLLVLIFILLSSTFIPPNLFIIFVLVPMGLTVHLSTFVFIFHCLSHFNVCLSSCSNFFFFLFGFIFT